MIPYADIAETADRRWTFRLLDRLGTADLPDADLDDLVGALQAASDPRSFATLESVVTDTGRPARIRKAASSALRGMRYVALDFPADKLRRWWLAGDVKHHAVDFLDLTFDALKVGFHPFPYRACLT